MVIIVDCVFAYTCNPSRGRELWRSPYQIDTGSSPRVTVPNLVGCIFSHISFPTSLHVKGIKLMIHPIRDEQFVVIHSR